MKRALVPGYPTTASHRRPRWKQRRSHSPDAHRLHGLWTMLTVTPLLPNQTARAYPVVAFVTGCGRSRSGACGGRLPKEPREIRAKRVERRRERLRTSDGGARCRGRGQRTFTVVAEGGGGGTAPTSFPAAASAAKGGNRWSRRRRRSSRRKPVANGWWRRRRRSSRRKPVANLLASRSLRNDVDLGQHASDAATFRSSMIARHGRALDDPRGDDDCCPVKRRQASSSLWGRGREVGPSRFGAARAARRHQGSAIAEWPEEGGGEEARELGRAPQRPASHAARAQGTLSCSRDDAGSS